MFGSGHVFALRSGSIFFFFEIWRGCRLKLWAWVTDNTTEALVLSQMIRWSERVHDHNNFLREEVERGADAENLFRHGWIYKTASELAEELMGTVSRRTISRALDTLSDPEGKKKYLDRRENPHHKWDRTYQYRVNLRRIIRDLQEKDYVLPGYPNLPIGQIVQSTGQNSRSTGQNSRSTGRTDRTIPETTSETTVSETNDSSSARTRGCETSPEENSKENWREQRIATLEGSLGSKAMYGLEPREKDRLIEFCWGAKFLIHQYTENDIPVSNWLVPVLRDNESREIILRADDISPGIRRHGMA